MMDKVPGSLAAAPIPMMTRPAISQSTLLASRRHDRATAEDGDPDEHDALAAEDVTEHPGDQHEAGERQRIPVDHPLQRGDPRVQVALDVGQADTDDGVVEEGEEEDPAQGGEREGLGGRSEPTLLDVESGRRALAPGEPSLPGSAARAPLERSDPGRTGLDGSCARVLPTHGAGSGIPNGVPPGETADCRRSRGHPSGVRGLGARLRLGGPAVDFGTADQAPLP